MRRETFLPLARPDMGSEEIAAVMKVIDSGLLTTGPKVYEFEKNLSEFLSDGEKLSVVGLNSCTSALFLGLKALGIKEGDEVIIPTWTFATTAQIVEWVGAKPVLCDISGRSLTIDIEKAENLITRKTKAIIPVHIAGYPCKMDELEELAKLHQLHIIEDAAHSVGTAYKGRKIGNFSDLTCFSFYATKNLAMGEGGAAVSRDERLTDKIRRLSYFGINKTAVSRYEQYGSWAYDIGALGYKCNLDSIHAALGLVQLKKLDRMNSRRREIASEYKQRLDSSIGFTEDSSDHFHTYHLFPIILPDGCERNAFIEDLKKNNIGSSVHFIPLHKHSYYREKYPNEDFPEANYFFKRIVSIPIFSSMSDDDVDYVIYHVNRLLRGS